jgi:hypothetical protein
MNLNDFMCIVHVKDKVYFVDREAFYLLCSLQQVEFGFEDPSEYDVAKEQMFTLTLSWLIDRKKAFPLERTPTHLAIKFRDE